MEINNLDSVAIVGLGLLGGSLGLALQRSFPHIKRLGYSHRASTRQKALSSGTVDSACGKLQDAVNSAELVILASPIGTFGPLMQEMADHLPDGCIVTDVGSTKALPVRLARKYLPGRVEFVGSHPIAGSEQRGVDFARADLFDNANCLITPTAKTTANAKRFITSFWQKLGMRTRTMNPAEHDRLLAQISHLPHVVATALVNCTQKEDMVWCGKGYLDTTRIASGPSNVWRDILVANADQSEKAIGRFIRELTRIQEFIRKNKEEKIQELLERARQQRDHLVKKKLQRKELPS
jgi:prephenate dehydrogenase